MGVLPCKKGKLPDYRKLSLLLIFMQRGVPAGINSRLEMKDQSGCCPSWACQAHSVMANSLKTAVKEESSGEQA